MKWSELKRLVNEYLEKKNQKDAEVWYFDQKAISGPSNRADVHVGEFHHSGEIEIYID